MSLSLRALANAFFARADAILRRQSRIVCLNGLLDRGLLQIGRHTYGHPSVHMYKGSEHKVVIGAFCSVGPGVTIITGGVHPIDWVSQFPFRVRWGMPGAYNDGMPSSRGDVVIGSDVWLGTDAMILSGVRIGHGAVVAARSVVTRDVPPFAYVAGVPARVVRLRFEADIIDQLLEISWWDWTDERIREAVPLLSSSRVEEFVHRYGAAAKP
jgi:acetyltransferase-like isoleucine patch superfamily enzyme